MVHVLLFVFWKQVNGYFDSKCKRGKTQEVIEGIRFSVLRSFKGDNSNRKPGRVTIHANETLPDPDINLTMLYILFTISLPYFYLIYSQDSSY